MWDGIPTTNNTADPVTLYWRGEVHNDEENTHKFYEVIVDGTAVIRRWGRVHGYEIKSSPRTLVSEFETDGAALAAAFGEIQKRFKRGYSQISMQSAEEFK